MAADTVTITEIVNAALDKQYNATGGKVLKQIQQMSSLPQTAMQRSLLALEDETDTLQTENELLKPGNAQLASTLRELARLFIVAEMLIRTNAPSIEAGGQAIAIPAVTAKVFLNITGQLIVQGTDPLAAIGIYEKLIKTTGVQWNTAADRVIAAATKFTETPAWITRMNKWGKGYADLVESSIMAGLENGWGPKYTAQILRQFAENIPVAAAENLTRTLQLTAYREASLAMENINGQFIQYKIRIATLDQRTCLTCISLHGTRLERGQRVDDHYRGRCSEYYVVPGGEPLPKFMQSDSLPGKRNFVPFQTGEEWFKGLPLERQKLQASFVKSPGKWNAYTAGNPLSSFLADRNDDVFGHQVTENSIIGAFGEELAQTYYVK
jgi:hypothetical protein